MQEKLYSIKMRAAQGGSHQAGGAHISGAERIIKETEIKTQVNTLIDRALQHSKGQADFINISLEVINQKEVKRIPALPVTTIEVENHFEGRQGVIRCLQALGYEEEKAKKIIRILEEAPALRGAILLDIHTLERLEPSLSRGVRVTGMDWSPNIMLQLHQALDEAGINNEHIREALALASKVSLAPGIVAEICWSDDPHYTAGYVASKKLGYIRFNHLKPKGLAKGGRIFCFDSTLATKEQSIEWLEKVVTILEDGPSIKGRYSLKEVEEKNLWNKS